MKGSISVRLDKDVARLLARAVRLSGRTQSEVIRDALRRQLAIDVFDQMRRRVAPFTFRADRAGISMRLLRTSDSSVIAFYSQRKEAGSNLTTPDRIIEKIAQRIRDGL